MSTSAFAKDIKKLIVQNISQTFPNVEKRLSVWAETDKYNWKEDESVWNQKKGKTAPQFEAYFDGQFICFMDESNGRSYNLIEFLNGIKKLYLEKKIFVHQEMYEVIDAQKQAADKPIEVPKATSEADEMIIKVVEKHAKKRGKKVVQK